MYVVTEKCLVAHIPINEIAFFKQKKKAVQFKNRISKQMNFHPLYKGFKYKVIKEYNYAY